MNRRRLLRLGVVLAALFLIVRAALYDRGVIVRNREFARRLWAGEPLYGGGLHLPYPPSWALAMSPLLLVPLPAARILWAAAQVGAALAAGALLRRLGARAGLPPAHHLPALVFAFVAAGRFLLRDVRGGGASLLLLLAALLALERLGRRRETAAGALLGGLTALKLTPGLLLLWLPWKGFHRGFRAGLAAAALVFLLPGVILGPDAYIRTVAAWAGRVTAYLAADDLVHDRVLVPFTWMNQSLRQALYRYLVHIDFPHPLYADVLRLPPEAAVWLSRAGALGAALLLFAATRRGGAPGSALFAAQGAAVLCAAAFLSPIAWRPHFVALLPGLYLLAHRWLARHPRPRGLTAVLALYLLLTVGTNQEVWGDHLAEGIQAWYPVTAAALLVTAALLAVRPRPV